MPCKDGSGRHCRREEYYGDRCEVCGLFYPHGCAPWDDDSDEYPEDEWGDEPTGSCDNCRCNLYRGEDYDGLCSQCAWFAGQG